MREERGSWYLLTGLIMGIVLGLIYSWIIAPIEYVDTTPDTLRSDYQDHYRLTISLAFQSTEDLARAQARLELLGDEDYALALAEQAQRHLAEGGTAYEAQALADLAGVLGQAPIPFTASPVPTDTQSPPTETPTFTLSPTAIDTSTPRVYPDGDLHHYANRHVDSDIGADKNHHTYAKGHRYTCTYEDCAANSNADSDFGAPFCFG